MTTDLPPFLATVSNQISRDLPQEVDDAVTYRNSPWITRFQTLQVVVHQKRKWHNAVLWWWNPIGTDYARRLSDGLSVSSAQILEW